MTNEQKGTLMIQDIRESQSRQRIDGTSDWDIVSYDVDFEVIVRHQEDEEEMKRLFAELKEVIKRYQK